MYAARYRFHEPGLIRCVAMSEQDVLWSECRGVAGRLVAGVSDVAVEVRSVIGYSWMVQGCRGAGVQLPPRVMTCGVLRRATTSPNNTKKHHASHPQDDTIMPAQHAQHSGHIVPFGLAA